MDRHKIVNNISLYLFLECNINTVHIYATLYPKIIKNIKHEKQKMLQNKIS